MLLSRWCIFFVDLKERRRAEIEEKLEQKRELEKEEAMQAKSDLFEERKTKKSKIARLSSQLFTIHMVCVVYTTCV